MSGPRELRGIAAVDGAVPSVKEILDGIAAEAGLCSFDADVDSFAPGEGEDAGYRALQHSRQACEPCLFSVCFSVYTSAWYSAEPMVWRCIYGGKRRGSSRCVKS